MIALQVNGRRVELDAPTPLLTYLEKLGVSARAVAVELNGVIIERSAYENAKLGEGDVVEIVRMVGGGSGVSGNELDKARPRPPTPRQGWREEERIAGCATTKRRGPLTPASAPAGRSAEMGRCIGERISRTHH